MTSAKTAAKPPQKKDSPLRLSLGISRIEDPRAKKRELLNKNPGPEPEGFSYMMNKHLPKDLKDKILKRDNNTCKFCGFTASKYQNIQHIDHNLRNIDEKNLVTACLFCHQCFHLDQVGNMESGTLIWLPEVKQSDLNHMARAIYVGRISQGDIAAASRKAYEILLARREGALQRIGTDNPYILALVLEDYLTVGSYRMRHQKLEGLRLLPLDKRKVKESDLEFNQFPQILAYWRSKNGPFGGKAPTQWISITQKLIAQNAKEAGVV